MSAIYEGYVPKGLRATQRNTNQVPMQFEGHNGGPFEGDAFFVSVPDFEHATLCRAFRLDQSRFWFDVPSTMRGIGSNRGDNNETRRHRHGFVMMGDRPVASIRVVDENDRFVDRDPLDPRNDHDLANWVRR